MAIIIKPADIDGKSRIEFRDKKNEKVPFWSFHSLRFYIAFILLFINFSSNLMRDNLGISMLCMVNSTFLEETQNSNNHSSLNYENTGTLEWTPVMQGFLFSSISYGSLITAIFSGYICDLYGPRNVALISILTYSVLNLFSPLIATYDYYAYAATRAVMGLAEGCMIPVVATISAMWFLPIERSTAAAIFTTGYQFGNGIAMLLGGQLCSVPLLGGWPLIFYVSGILGMICFIVCYFLAANSPLESKHISAKELAFLRENMKDSNLTKKRSKKAFKVPWKSLLLSGPVWAVVLADYSFSCQMLFMQQFLPIYLRDVLGLDIKINGIYSAVPFLSLLIFKNILSFLADKLRHHNIFSMTISCKIMQAFAAFGSSGVLIALSTLKFSSQATLALVLLFFFGVCYSGAVAGFFTAIICIAPPYTGIIASMGNLAQIIARITTPTIIGYIITGATQNEWTIIFYAIAALNIITGGYFMVYGSADVQSWARIPVGSEKPNEDKVKAEALETDNL